MKMRHFFILGSFFLFTALIMLAAGCSSNGPTTASGGTGGVTAKLVWDASDNTAPTNTSSAQIKTPIKVMAQAAVGVATVRVIVSGPDMSNIQSDFPLANGRGVINGIPAGSGRTVKVLGLDATGLVKYQSEVNNITIQAGQTTDLGTIIMQQITYVLSGQAQKGPLIFGSSIWASELDATLNSTGITYLAQTDDDLGNFYVGANIKSNLVDLLGEGYYMDELTGGLSTSPITLRAVADLSVYSTPIINILTTIQRPRLKSLILAGQTYQAAMQQSQTEALAAFGIDATKITGLQALSAMQINGTADQDSVLLATSAILSKMATNAATVKGSSQAAEMTYYLSRIASEIQNTGVLSNAAIIASRNLAATQIDLAAVRSNVETYYANRGFTYVASKFEEWVDKDASGVLPRRLVPPTGLSFTDTTSAEPNQLITSNTITVSGLGTGVVAPVTVSSGTTIIKNGTAVPGTSNTAIDGDTIALRVTSSGYGLTTSSTIQIGSSSVTWSVTSKLLVGTISGLTGSGLILQNNGGNDIAIPAGTTSFSFSSPLSNGTTYNISVLTQPSTTHLQDCTVTNGTGTVGATVSNISISCSAAQIAYLRTDHMDLMAYRINPTTGGLTTLGQLNYRSNDIPSSYRTFIAVDPTNRFFYVVGSIPDPNSGYAYTYAVGTNYVSANIITNSGIVTNTGVTVGGSKPYSIAIDPTSKFAYVLGGDDISAFSINATTGALTSIGTYATGANGQYSGSIVVDPTGKFAYASVWDTSGTNKIAIYSINSTTGTLTSIDSVGTNSNGIFSIAIDPTSRFLYAAAISTAGMGGQAGSVLAYSLNPTTGALTSIGSVAIGSNDGLGSIAVDPTGKFAYVVNYVSGGIHGYSINSTTGALSSIGTFSAMFAGRWPYHIAIDLTGKFAYVADETTVQIYSINATTGALTRVDSVLRSNFGNGIFPAPAIAITRAQ